MSTMIKNPSTLPATVSPQHEQQPRKEHWRGDLPPPPSNLTFCPPKQERYPNSLNIINRHGNLLSLLDAVYPPTICQLCDIELTSPSETDQHYQTKHFHHQHHNSNKKIKQKQRYLCLSPHCDQTFRSRGLLRFHISTCHLVDNEQVPKTDPLYLLYAPPSSSSDLGVHMSANLSPNNNNNSTNGGGGGVAMMVPQKRKYERRQKTWNPVGKSSVPGQTNFTLPTTTTTSSLDLNQPQPKRRGRPPKIKSVMPLSNMINNNNNNDNHRPSPPSMITFPSGDSGKNKSQPIGTSSSSASSSTNPQAKVFRMVQQVIPQHVTSVSTPSFSFPSSTLRPKNISRSNLSQTSQILLAEKYNPLVCPACSMTFQRKKNVATHLATAHSGEECFQCIYSDCYHPKRFSTREGLVYHILHSHDTGNGNGGGFKMMKGSGGSSDTSTSELALMDSSDTASMDDDAYQTTTTTMVQPLKDEDGNDNNNNFRQVRKNTMGMMDHSIIITRRKSNGAATTTATPTKTSSQRGRKKRS